MSVSVSVYVSVCMCAFVPIHFHVDTREEISIEVDFLDSLFNDHP